MLDPLTQSVLQDLFRRENRSLLQYLNESFPWTAPEHQDAIRRMRQLAAEEQESIGRVARFLQRRRIPLPYLGSFPEEFTNINFIGLDYGLGRLVTAERDAIAVLEGEIARLTDPDARALVADILRQKQGHLKELEALAGSQPATTVR